MSSGRRLRTLCADHTATADALDVNSGGKSCGLRPIRADSRIWWWRRSPKRITRYPDIERLTLTPKDPNDCWRQQPIAPGICHAVGSGAGRSASVTVGRRWTTHLPERDLGGPWLRFGESRVFRPSGNMPSSDCCERVAALELTAVSAGRERQWIPLFSSHLARFHHEPDSEAITAQPGGPFRGVRAGEASCQWSAGR